MTEYYSAFEQPLLDRFGKIGPKIDDRRAHDAGKPVIPLVQDGQLGPLDLDRKIYCSVPSRCIRSPIQGCFRRVFRTSSSKKLDRLGDLVMTNRGANWAARAASSRQRERA
jgi:hypothetical protein